jgi:hypothetical protein
MYCNIFEEVCREPLSKIQLEKKGGRGDFPRVCGEPLNHNPDGYIN